MLFARKSLTTLQAEGAADTGLQRSLGLGDLMMLGVGGVVGTGIFVLTGHAAAANAGPAVTVSFAISATAAMLAGLCYAEMASMIPVAGSAYTYAYATLGELLAFVIGWDLVLEYGVAASTVAVGWSGYVRAFVQHVSGVELPWAWTTAPLLYDVEQHTIGVTGAHLNVPAMAIILAITVVLALGVRLSVRVVSAIVVVKLTVIGLFIAAAAPRVDTALWHPFVPANTGDFGHFGVSGVFRAATMLFFAYCGFDAVSTAAQECRRPQRDVPIGMIGSVLIASLLYMAVSLVLTGVVPYQELSVPYPIAKGIEATGHRWLEVAVDLGAVAGLTSVLLVQIYGQTRILFAMGRDGLLPASRVHKRFGTPVSLTLWVGGLAAIAGGILPIDILGELSSIGTLFAYVLVSLGVMILRLRNPELPRAFQVPWGPYLLPLASACVSTSLMFTATSSTLVRLFGWMAVGLCVYAAYSRRHSLLRAAATRSD